LVEYRIDGPQQWVHVPPAFLAVAWDGEVPVLVSPEGESHTAWSVPLVRGGRARIYSPFNTAEEASAAYEAWLTSRAIEAVYGRSVPVKEILRRYFEVEGGRLTGLKKGGLTLARDYPGLEPPKRGPGAPLVLLAVGLPWLILVALFFRTFRSGVGEVARQVVFWGALAVLLVVLLGLGTVATLAGWVNPFAVTALLESSIRELGRSAGVTLAVWAGCALLLAAGYRLAERTFLRVELPARPSRFTLIGARDELA